MRRHALRVPVPKLSDGSPELPRNGRARRAVDPHRHATLSRKVPGLERFRATDDPWTLPPFLEERYERVATLGELPSGPLELYRSRS